MIFALGFHSRTGNLVVTKQLTRNEYYEEAYINFCHDRSAKWNKTIKNLNDSLSEHHFHTFDENAFVASIQNNLNIHDELWSKKADSKKWARQRFFLYGTKRSTIQKFINSFVIDRIDGNEFLALPHVWYGDGQFPAGGRGERSVPVKYIREAFEKDPNLTCHEISEFRTSQVCPRCEQRLYKVVKRFSNGYLEVRGLGWCASLQCSDKPLWGRDRLACVGMNKKRVGTAGDIYDRNSPNFQSWAGVPMNEHILRRNTPKQH